MVVHTVLYIAISAIDSVVSTFLISDVGMVVNAPLQKCISVWEVVVYTVLCKLVFILGTMVLTILYIAIIIWVKIECSLLCKAFSVMGGAICDALY